MPYTVILKDELLWEAEYTTALVVNLLWYLQHSCDGDTIVYH